MFDFNIRTSAKGKVNGKMSQKYANICGLICYISWSIVAIGIAASLIIAAWRLTV